MKNFMDKDFLLDTQEEIMLYEKYAKNMPICDYHCHLAPKEIYENKAPKTITRLWLSGDHYKWRIMRAMGFDEKYITGDGDEKEKFLLFAKALQYAIGNPLYHWAHLELQKYFGIKKSLNENTAEEIYEKANETIKNGDFRPQTLINQSGVKIICTTDDPIDNLEYHKLLKEQNLLFKVLPTFRPDRALNIEKDDFGDYIKKLEEVSGVKITCVDDVIKALVVRMDYFVQMGSKVSDQSFATAPFEIKPDDEIEDIFKKGINNEKLSETQADAYRTKIFTSLMAEYKNHNMVCEIHLGAMRNNNTSMFRKIGVDTGFDIMNDKCVSEPLNKLLDYVNEKSGLAKTVLFNLNCKDNLVLSATAGNFQFSGDECPIQFGPAWWFLDTLDGMTNQMKTLASSGLLGQFIGMETDSRSFTSYARHDYFRRIMCHIIGEWINKGLIDFDEKITEKIIKGICFDNAMKYFDF